MAKSLNSPEKAKLLDGLKGSKYTLLKTENQLTIQQKEKLEQIKDVSPLVGIMHSLKKEFHLLFESSQDVGSGTKRGNCLVKKG